MRRPTLRMISLLCVLAAANAAGCFRSACASGRSNSVAGSSAGPIAEGEVPPGFTEMEVLGVLPTSEGHAVFLVDEEQEKVLPIWIGPGEAMSIQFRLERRRFERPLTHDLLDSLVQELGGRIVRIHVDDLKGSTFVATVFVQAEGGLLALDARPSDAIAVAVGNMVPIFVALDVLERAAVGPDGLPDESFDDAPPVERAPQDRPSPEPEDPGGIIGPPPTQSL